jgi:HK97 family phage portal protein
MTRSGLSVDERKVILSGYYAALASAGITLQGQDRAKPWPVERAVAEGYERVVWVFKAVEAIAGNSSRLPFRLKEGESEVTDHPLYRVLNVKANPLETGRIFRKRLSAQVLLSKRGAFVEVGRNNAQEIIRLDLLPPGRTSIIPGTGNDPISHYEVAPLGGGTPRRIDPEKVRWVREPHPLDPYSGITPLEAAGLSVELDHFARLYNVSFMRNDGRPGGILGVKAPEKGGGDMDDEEMDRIEARFGRGPVEAGKLSVISGDLSYVDVASKPRDLQYQATSKNAKTEMLVAFGVPESQLGNAADRTFANAAEEGYAFWTQTMSNHNDVIVSAFAEDSEDAYEGYLDTSSIEVLQRAEVAKRQEAREEVAAGLRSIRSYAVLAGMEDEVEDTAITRALYVAGGKTPIPSRAEDAEALGIAPPASASPDAPAGTEDPAATDPAAATVTGGEQPVAVEDAGAAVRSAADTAGLSPSEAVAQALATGADAPAAGTKSLVEHFAANGGTKSHLRVLDGGLPMHRRTVLTVQRETKAADDSEGDPHGSSALDDGLRLRTESDVADALTGLAERQVKRSVARLKSPAQRKGTRHWEPEYEVDLRVGTKALDAASIADEDRWASEAADAVQGILDAAAATAVEALIADLGLPESKALPARILRRMGKAVDEAVRLVADSATKQGRMIADLVNDLDQAGAGTSKIVEALKALAKAQSEWAKGLAVQAVTAALEGARDSVVALLAEDGDLDVMRSWLSRRDGIVRASHAKADGQKQPIGEPFEVGGALLRYPGDPKAPIRETANCRCKIIYKSKATGRFVSPDAARRTG